MRYILHGEEQFGCFSNQSIISNVDLLLMSIKQQAQIKKTQYCSILLIYFLNAGNAKAQRI